MIAMSKLLLILLLLAGTNAFADIIKWVDDQGRVHYSDQPPPQDAQPKTLRSDSESGDAAGSEVPAEQTIAERAAELKRNNLEKQAAADKAAQKKATEDALKQNCADAQANLTSLQSGVRIMEIDAKGERTYIDDTERQQRIAKAQRNISNSCK
jgi:Domain of unknown function (DUF4124)